MWQDIRGHDTFVEQFRRAYNRGRLAGTFLFVGPPGVGKRRFAFALAMSLLCKQPADLNPCGECDSCKLFGGRSSTDIDFESAPFLSPHPDLYYISAPPGKDKLPLELLIGDEKHRGRDGLCYDISRKPFLSERKMAIINDADFLKGEGANALLKTLEEPPPDTMIILIGTSTAKQLPTIRSRCQIVRFAPLPPEILSAILVKKGIVSSEEEGKKWASQAEGSLDQAKEFADGAVDSMRTQLMKHLTASHGGDAGALMATLHKLLEDLGKDTALQRQRMRLLFGFAVEYFRSEMKGESSRRAARRLERTLDALGHIDSNVNPTLVMEAWSAALASEG